MSTPAADPACACEVCGRPLFLCVCDRVEPKTTRLRVVVLQHPREEREPLGTARILAGVLPAAKIVVGLSWASLGDALDEEGVEPSKWGVLFPGKPTDREGDADEGEPKEEPAGTLRVLDRKGQRVEKPKLVGIVAIDGTWSQAKTLWWRNAWFLRLQRLVLTPKEPSMYGKLREEPRKQFVSTLEAIADTLVLLGEPAEVRDALRRPLRTMLQRARDSGAFAPPKRPPARRPPRKAPT